MASAVHLIILIFINSLIERNIDPLKIEMVNFKVAFESVPGVHLLLLPDPPRFTIITATYEYFRSTGKKSEEITGKGLFEAFPRNPDDPDFTGPQNLAASFQLVIQDKKEHELPVQRYDVTDERGGFEERYWSAKNKPVIDENGEVVYIIHSATDITRDIIAGNMAVKIKDLEKAHNLFMQVPAIVTIFKGEENVIELANDATLKLMGKTADIIGKPLIEALPELRDNGLPELLEQVRKTGKPFFATEMAAFTMRSGTRETRYFDVLYQPYYEAESTQSAGVFTISHDVTELVLAKKKIEESEAKYRSLFETMDQGFCIIEMIFDKQQRPVDYLFLEVNPIFEKHNGLKNAAGKTVLELVPGLEQHWFNLYGEVAITGQSIRFREGSEAMGRWFDVYAFRIGNNSPDKVAILFTDITEHKKAEEKLRESEERFRHLADESPMFVFIIDPDPLAPVSYWNKTWLQYTGQSLEEALGRAWNGIIYPDDISAVMADYIPAFEKRQSYFLPAIRVKRYDGQYRWHAFKGNPRYLPNGDFNGYIGVGFDIHEQKLAEEIIKENEGQLQIKVAERTAEIKEAHLQLEKTVQELKRSNTNLEEFAYAASHDLKEPIRKINFYSDRLKQSFQDRLTENDQRAFQRMEAASKRMGSLIEDILEYSQVSHAPRTLSEVNLNQLMELVLDDLDLEIEEKKATVKVEQLFTIRGHHRQLQQAFQNLIGNALKYKNPGVPPLIEISCRKSAAIDKALSDTYYVLSIKDNGIGFEQNDADRIFNVFTRLHGNHEFTGTGIGLSIVRKVIENHRGYITAISQPGEGARFDIHLPVERSSLE